MQVHPLPFLPQESPNRLTIQNQNMFLHPHVLAMISMTSHCFQKICKTCKEVYQLCRVGPSQPHLVSSTMRPASCDPGQRSHVSKPRLFHQTPECFAYSDPSMDALHGHMLLLLSAEFHRYRASHLRDTIPGFTTCSKRTIHIYDLQGFSIFKFKFPIMQPVAWP